jgi:hypothetical protein
MTTDHQYEERASMSMRRTVILGSLGWIAAISLLHLTMNLGLFSPPTRRGSGGAPPFRVGFLPVT